MTPIQKIDKVLNELSKTNDPRGQIALGFGGDDFGIDLHDIIEIMHQLKSDGFAEIIIKPYKLLNSTVPDVQHYIITFNGRLFNQKGGYEGQANLLALQTKLDSDRNQRMERNEVLLTTWTKRLFYGTIAAALILVTWEMYKTFVIEGHSFCH